MDDSIVIENHVDLSGVWHLHVMSNSDPHPALPQIKERFGGGEAEITYEAGIWHFRVCEAMRGMIRLELEGGMKRVAAMWSVAGYENMRAAIRDAVMFFDEHGKAQSDYVYVAKLPSGIENGFEIGNVMLFEAEWMIAGFVLVCSQS